MPRTRTLRTRVLKPRIYWASGLHDPASKQTHFFHRMNTGMVTIGRGSCCNICLREPHVSRFHARVTLQGNGRATIANESVSGT